MEELSTGATATRLRWFSDDECIWLDTDIGEQDGIVLGVGGSRDEAIDDAITELEAHIEDLKRARAMRIGAESDALERRK